MTTTTRHGHDERGSVGRGWYDLAYADQHRRDERETAH